MIKYNPRLFSLFFHRAHPELSEYIEAGIAACDVAVFRSLNCQEVLWAIKFFMSFCDELVKDNFN